MTDRQTTVFLTAAFPAPCWSLTKLHGAMERRGREQILKLVIEEQLIKENLMSEIKYKITKITQ